MLREHLHTHLIKCNRGNRRRDFFASLLFQLSFTSIHLIHTSNFSPPLRKYIFSETLYIIIYAKGEGFYEMKFFFFFFESRKSISSIQKYFDSSSRNIIFGWTNFYRSFLYISFSDINTHLFHLEKFKTTPHIYIYIYKYIRQDHSRIKVQQPQTHDPTSSKSTLEV